MYVYSVCRCLSSFLFFFPSRFTFLILWLCPYTYTLGIWILNAQTLDSSEYWTNTRSVFTRSLVTWLVWPFEWHALDIKMPFQNRTPQNPNWGPPFEYQTYIWYNLGKICARYILSFSSAGHRLLRSRRIKMFVFEWWST